MNDETIDISSEVTWYTLKELEDKYASRNYGADLLLHHAMNLLRKQNIELTKLVSKNA